MPTSAQLELCPRCGQAHTKCAAHVGRDPNLRPCRKPPVVGARVCTHHGGKAPQVQTAARRRLAEREVMATLADVEVVPIDAPLDELARYVARIVAYEGHLAGLVGQLDELTVETMFGPAAHVVVGMWERSLLTAQKVLADWVRLGFEDRKVRVDEIRAGLLAVVLAGVLRANGIDPESPAQLELLDLWLPVLDGKPAPIDVNEVPTQP